MRCDRARNKACAVAAIYRRGDRSGDVDGDRNARVRPFQRGLGDGLSALSNGQRALLPPATVRVVVCKPTDTPELDLAGRQVREQVLLVMRVARPRDAERCPSLFAMMAKRDETGAMVGGDQGKPVRGRRRCQYLRVGGGICLVADDATGIERYRLNQIRCRQAGFRSTHNCCAPNHSAPGPNDDQRRAGSLASAGGTADRPVARSVSISIQISRVVIATATLAVLSPCAP